MYIISPATANPDCAMGWGISPATSSRAHVRDEMLYVCISLYQAAEEKARRRIVSS